MRVWLFGCGALLVVGCGDGADQFGPDRSDEDVVSGKTAGSGGQTPSDGARGGGKPSDGPPPDGGASAQGGAGGAGSDICEVKSTDHKDAVCMKNNCCPQLSSCVNDAQCRCLLECFGSGGSPNICGNRCGGFDGAAWQSFQKCGDLYCRKGA